MRYVSELLNFLVKKGHIDWFKFDNGYLAFVVTHSDDISELRPVRDVGVYRRIIGGHHVIQSHAIEALSDEEVNTLILGVKNAN